MNYQLPKWPQMFTSGARVTMDQACEIIRRTDSFFRGYGGNDVAFDERLGARLRMPHRFRWDGSMDSDVHGQWERSRAWERRWGLIETSYVSNDWISCCFIFGAHGWCHPDGVIAYVDNVGKWPTIDEIAQDWTAVAVEFPFLDLAATLMSGEACEDGTAPVATILVCDGYVEVVDGDMRHHDRFPSVSIDRGMESYAITGRSEHGPIPETWYAAWESLAAEKLEAADRLRKFSQAISGERES